VIAVGSRHVLRSVLIVLGWAVPAAATAIVVVAVGINLPQETQSASGIAVLLAFLGTLVVGPIWTIRGSADGTRQRAGRSPRRSGIGTHPRAVTFGARPC